MTATTTISLPVGVPLVLVYADGTRHQGTVVMIRNGWATLNDGWQVRASAVVRVEVVS